MKLHPSRSLRLAVAGATAAALAAAPYAGASGAVADGTYVNPVSKGFADTFADPSLIKAKDGRWYAYGTSDPLREGETEPRSVPIASSSDLVNWSYVGEAFNESNRPTWATDTAGLWAPDIRYFDGTYHMYYTVTDTFVSDDTFDTAIGVATAPTPAGPWTDSGGPVVAPRPGPGGGYLWTIDPAQFTAADGTRYLYYGSYYGGIFVTELSADGTRTVGPETMVAIDNRYEGAYVVRHSGWYYLFASEANCCAGPTTGYSVFAGRSRSPLGPFRDRDGIGLTTSRVGGTAVIQPNGNRWVGTGHNAMATDLAGETWLAYHAIDRHDPYLNEPFGINERPMLLDRLDWIGGWPTARAGAWASAGVQRAPTTTGPVDDDFNRDGGVGSGWQQVKGDWHLRADREGAHVTQTSSDHGVGMLIARAEVPRDVRAEADLRLGDARAAGVQVRWADRHHYAVSWLDRRTHSLVVRTRVNGARIAKAAKLPADVDLQKWHHVAVEVRGRHLTARVTDARLGDPYAVVKLRLPAALDSGRVGVAVLNGTASADNVSAAALYTPVTKRKGTPRHGEEVAAYSDEFEGATLNDGWHWVREDPDAQVSDGALRWPTEAADLTGDSNNAGVLLRDMPAGDYTVETKLHINLGVDTIRNYEQAGLIVYNSDDSFLRLSHVAIWNTRQTEFGKEQPFADGTAFGGMAIGTPAPTTWMRLSHRVNPRNGEHRFRAATSRDGTEWTWGGTWTLPAGSTPQVGLISHGGDNPPATAAFAYFRVYVP